MDDANAHHGTLENAGVVELTGKIMVIAIIVLFMVVVFVLALHLYARWFWWRVEGAADPNGQPSRRRRRFVFAPGQDPAIAALRRGLDPSVIRSLPELVFRAEDFKEGLECAVCLSEIAEGEKARLLPKCNHGFHVDCIDMWFQSHSTCPLCRNLVAAEPSNSAVAALEDNVRAPEEPSAAGFSTETPNYPTNVLFWGNDTQISSRTACLEEGPSQLPCPLSSSTASTSTRSDRALVIDIPRQMLMGEGLLSSSPSASRFAEEELKSPMTTRLRSLKRLLSREKRSNPCSPASIDVELAGRGQS